MKHLIIKGSYFFILNIFFSSAKISTLLHFKHNKFNPIQPRLLLIPNLWIKIIKNMIMKKTMKELLEFIEETVLIRYLYDFSNLLYFKAIYLIFNKECVS